MNVEEKRSFLTNVFFTATVIGLIYLISKVLFSYLLPFVIGIILAFIVQKPAKMIESRFKINAGICAAIMVIFSYLLLIGVAFFSIRFTILLINRVMSLLPGVFGSVSKCIADVKNSILSDNPTLKENMLNDFLTEAFDAFSSKITTFFSAVMTDIAANIPRFLLGVIITMVASFYIAKDFERLIKFSKGLIKEVTYNKIVIIKNIIMESVVKITAGYLLIMLITFAELIFGLFLLKIRYFIIIAALISIVDLLPVLGTGTVIIPWALFSLVCGDTVRGIGLIVIYTVITIIRNFIEPKIIGKKIGINPLFTLVSVFLGMKTAGIAGMIIVPVTFITIIKYYKKQLHHEKGN